MPLENMNEFTSHMLEVVHAHMVLRKSHMVRTWRSWFHLGPYWVTGYLPKREASWFVAEIVYELWGCKAWSCWRASVKIWQESWLPWGGCGAFQLFILGNQLLITVFLKWPSLWCPVSPQRSYSRDCSQHIESLSRFPLLGRLTWRAMEEAAAWLWMDSQPIRARWVGAASPGAWRMLLQHHVWQRNASSVTLKGRSSSSTLLSIDVGKAWLCTNGGSCFSRCWTWLKTALSPKGWACRSWNFSSKIWACQQSSKFVETRDVVEIQMVLPGVW